MFFLNLPFIVYFAACIEGTNDHKQASDALRQLSNKIAKAKATDPVAPYLQELDRVRNLPCLRISREQPRHIQTKSTLALRTFWQDGGEDWLSSYLATPPKGGTKEIVLPPDLRTHLTPSEPGSVPPWLICNVGDSACGQGTAGWLLRAEALTRPNHRSADDKNPPRDIAQLCNQEKKPDPAEDRYLQWRRCVEEQRTLRAVPPLGSFRTPTNGFWVLRGRRGHYNFCDEIRAYDLQTGAAYIAQSCTGLFLAEDGRVVSGKTDAGRKIALRRGRVSIDNLREAALFVLLAKEVKRVQTHAEQVPLPAGLTLRWPESGGFGVVHFDSFWVSSSQTQLKWSMGTKGQLLAEGSLTWPYSSDAGEDYVTNLLRVTEAGMQDGCPPAPLLWPLPDGKRPPNVSPLDAPSGTKGVQDELAEQLQTFAKTPCK